MLDDLLLRMRSLFWRKTVERELGDELRFHFDQLVERRVRAGLPVAEVRRRAQLEFGGFGQVQEECRDARGTLFLDGLMQDFRYSFRMLRMAPGFAAVVAKRFFPNTNPIGKHVRDTYPANPSDVEVVGLVSDIKVNSLRVNTRPRIYAPLFIRCGNKPRPCLKCAHLPLRRCRRFRQRVARGPDHRIAVRVKLRLAS